MRLPLERFRSEILGAWLAEHGSQELDPLQTHVTSDMNDAVVDLLTLTGLGLCLVVYEALLVVAHMIALDEESRRLGTRSMLLTSDRINYLRLT